MHYRLSNAGLNASKESAQAGWSKRVYLQKQAVVARSLLNVAMTPIAYLVKKGERGMPSVLTAKTWGFYDVLFKVRYLIS